MSAEAPLAVLIGPMGAGKTRIGKRVAKRLGVGFLDTDRMVQAEHGPIPELFRDRGEDGFRALEREAVSAALATGGVVSLGGGAVLHPETRADLRAHRVVLLLSTAEAVLARIDTRKRPLLAEDPGAWERIFREREPVYRELATATFDTSTRPITDIAADVAAWAERTA